jgi:hypothetical protein
MINLSNMASSFARVAFGDANKPKMDMAINVVSHIAGRVGLQVIGTLLEQRFKLGEHQQKGISVVLDALRGKEAVRNVETHPGGGRFNLARAAYDVASVVWERDVSMPKTMSFLGISDSRGNLLFSLGKKLADALATRGPALHMDNGVATSARNAFLSSNLKLSKVMQDIAAQVFNATQQPDNSAAPASSSGLPPQSADSHADAGPLPYTQRRSGPQAQANARPYTFPNQSWPRNPPPPSPQGPGVNQQARKETPFASQPRTSNAPPPPPRPSKASNVNQEQVPPFTSRPRANTFPDMNHEGYKSAADEAYAAQDHAERPASPPGRSPAFEAQFGERPRASSEPPPRPTKEPAAKQQQARNESVPPSQPPKEEPKVQPEQARAEMPPPPPPKEHTLGDEPPSTERPDAKTAADASAKVADAGPAKPPIKPLYKHLNLADMTADFSAIRKAYMRSARDTHPDKNIGMAAAATERFKIILNAYEILSDPEKRNDYDRGLIDEQGRRLQSEPGQ